MMQSLGLLATYLRKDSNFICDALRTTRSKRLRLVALKRNDSIFTVEAIIRNPNVSSQELALTAGHPSAYIRSLTARHPKTPLSALLILIADTEAGIRNAAAKHSKLPTEVKVQVFLAGDN